MMTRKSLLEGNPNRDYLNALYSDKELNRFLYHKAPKDLKKQVKMLDKELIRATAQQLKILSREALANTDSQYFSIDPATHKPYKQSPPDKAPAYQDFISAYSEKIKTQIEACKDDWSRKKINSFWIKVMIEAYHNKDQLTFSIIQAALDSQINGVYSGRSDKMRREFYDNNLISDMGFLDQMSASIKSNRYDCVPDPAVFLSQAALMQQALANHEKPAETTTGSLRYFKNYHAYLQKTFSTMPKENLTVELQQDNIQAVTPEADFKEPNPTIADSKNDTPDSTVSDVKTPEPVTAEVKNIDTSHNRIQEANKQKHLIRMTIIPSSEDKNNEVPEKILQYLKLITDGWDALGIEDKAPNKNSAHTPRELINEFLKAYSHIDAKNQNQIPSLKKMISNLQQLQENLKKSAGHPQILNYFRRKFSKNTFDTTHLLQINEDIKALSQMTASIEAHLKKTEKKADVLVAAPAAPEIIPIAAVVDEPAAAAAASFVNTDETKSSPATPDEERKRAITTFTSDDLDLKVDTTRRNSGPEDATPEYTTDHKQVNCFPLSRDEWEWISSTISPQGSDHKTGLQATHDEDAILASVTPIEYVNKNNETRILESRENNIIKVSVTNPPTGYGGMSTEEKTNIDLQIANSMIDLLVSRCSNSPSQRIEILDDPDNASRMCALILVCEARHLHYKLADSITNPTVSNDTAKTNKLDSMRGEMTADTRSLISKSISIPVHDATMEPTRLRK